MSRIDNGGGAEISQHVSPTVSAKPTLDVGGVSIMENEDQAAPPASGDEGTPQLKQTNAVQHDKLEY